MSSSSVQPPARSTLPTPLSMAGTGGANSTAASGDQPFGQASGVWAAAGAQSAQVTAAPASVARRTRTNPAIKPSRCSMNPCCERYYGRVTVRKPMWLIPVSVICCRRAAGR